MSGAEVAGALREAGHEVREADVLPDDSSALDDFRGWGGDVVFPVLHGRWGEGGALQRKLAERGLPFVGSDADAAERCIDKHRTKQVFERHGIATPAYELVGPGERPTLAPPVVVKVPDEGSSIGLAICHTAGRLDDALLDLRKMSPTLLVEQFIAGYELTVGVIDSAPTPAPGSSSLAPRNERRPAETLPPIHVVPAETYYDYDAKYTRDDTQYRFELPGPVGLERVLRDTAYHAYHCLGCRHLARVDFILDEAGQLWCIEVNTMPGFTTHSLLPMAARQAGLTFPMLVDHLARLAAGDGA